MLLWKVHTPVQKRTRRHIPQYRILKFCSLKYLPRWAQTPSLFSLLQSIALDQFKKKNPKYIIIVKWLWAWKRGILFLFLAKSRASWPPLGSTIFCPVGTGMPISGSEADHTLPHSAERKKEGAVPSVIRTSSKYGEWTEQGNCIAFICVEKFRISRFVVKPERIKFCFGCSSLEKLILEGREKWEMLREEEDVRKRK